MPRIRRKHGEAPVVEEPTAVEAGEEPVDVVAEAAALGHETSVEETSDPEFEQLYVASPWDASCSCGEWTERRSSEGRAQQSCDEHLVAVVAAAQEETA